MAGQAIAVDLEWLTTPRDGPVITNRWWVYREGAGVLFHRLGRSHFPQCNTDKAVAEHVRARLYPDDTLKFVEVTYLGREYAPRSD